MMAGVDFGVVDLLISLSETETNALQIEYACGQIDGATLEEQVSTNPIIVWGIRAREANHLALRQAYTNVNKSLKGGDLKTSKWLISRQVPTAKDQAMIEVLKLRALNDQLALLTKLKGHSETAYRAALSQMNIEGAPATNHIKALNAELRREEAKGRKEVVNAPSD